MTHQLGTTDVYQLVLMTVQLPSMPERENISLDKIYYYNYKQTTSTQWRTEGGVWGVQTPPP